MPLHSPLSPPHLTGIRRHHSWTCLAMKELEFARDIYASQARAGPPEAFIRGMILFSSGWVQHDTTGVRASLTATLPQPAFAGVPLGTVNGSRAFPGGSSHQGTCGLPEGRTRVSPPLLSFPLSPAYFSFASCCPNSTNHLVCLPFNQVTVSLDTG